MEMTKAIEQAFPRASIFAAVKKNTKEKCYMDRFLLEKRFEILPFVSCRKKKINRVSVGRKECKH
jgi:hypothetical protein